MSSDSADTEAKIAAQAAVVTALKKDGASKDDISEAVAVLLKLKGQEPAPKKVKAAKAATPANKGKKKKGEDQFKKADEPAFVNMTPVGHLKNMTAPMDSGYNPQKVEASWNDWWEQQNLFKPHDDDSKEKFVLCIPPPNVTGRLHIGHALTVGIEDCLVRWNRMRGKQVVWVPGTDHAGIATQVVVEKKLMKEQQKTRQDLGRDDFLKEVWKWKEENGGFICKQMRVLGCSVDWSREVFTMDELRCKAVTEAFVQLYAKGLIYRENRLVNWSCALKTAISSIEVDFIDIEKPTMLKVPGHEKPVEFGVIHSFAYKFEDGGEVVVATTRIETMLGDAAVCVHPDDARYKKYHGKKLLHPFCPDRDMRIICDAELVDMEFGTGAVKITPAHDPNDFECGRRHNLEQINVLDDNGLINSHGGKIFTGMKRFEAREAVIAELDKLGLFRGKGTNPMRLGLCQRSKDVIEPVVRPQWWMNCKELAARGVELVRNDELKIVPSFHKDTWFHWLENIREWCISRQLWWGHRIPAYLALFNGESAADVTLNQERWIVAATEEAAHKLACDKFPEHAASLRLWQDPDVLDTWFSSGLFPFSTMGWPDDGPDNKDLSRFFPGSLLETGHDILFFWVARMVMMSLSLHDKLPFSTVYLHAMVRDKSGKKMSKSLGNVIDPLDVVSGTSLAKLHAKLEGGNLDPKEVVRAKKLQQTDFPNGIAECGADALRFGLLSYTLQGKDINLNIDLVVAYRQFCNKLWNVLSFTKIYFAADWKRPGDGSDAALVAAVNESLGCEHGTLVDRWMISCLTKAVADINSTLEAYEFATAAKHTHVLWLNTLCDVYLEAIKPRVKGDLGDEAKQAVLIVLFACMEIGLRALHPFMPFLTEELYQRLPGSPSSLAAAAMSAEEKAAAAAAPATAETAASPALTGLSTVPYSGEGPNLECGSIMISAYPDVSWMGASWRDERVEQTMEQVNHIVHAARSLRSSVGIVKDRVPAFILATETDADQWFSRLGECTADVATLSQSSEVTVLKAGAEVPAGCVSVVIDADVTLSLFVKDFINFSVEIGKLQKKSGILSAQIATVKTKMAVPSYKTNTNAEVQEKDVEKCNNLQQEVDSIDSEVNKFLAMMTADEKKALYEANIVSIEKDMAKHQKSIDKVAKGKPREDWSKKMIKFIDADTAAIAALTVRLNKQKELLAGGQ